jgi:hypothetical protein
MGNIKKNSHSDLLANRMMASFHAIANIFFIAIFLVLSGAPSVSRGAQSKHMLLAKASFDCALLRSGRM